MKISRERGVQKRGRIIYCFLRVEIEGSLTAGEVLLIPQPRLVLYFISPPQMN